MTTTAKEPIPSSTQAQSSTPGGPNAAQQTTRRTDAVGVEIPVVVHASRYSAATRGAGKTLPAVHEETRTVIVFPQGAVVRLSAAMTPGEPVVLTNQQTGSDVLCRVVNVKAQPGIQNYVDLEFTQRAPGFWGECFASERPSGAESSIVTTPPARVIPPAAPAPNPEPVSLPQSGTEPMSTVPVAATELPSPASALVSVPPIAPNVSPARTASAVPASSSISGMSSGLRLSQAEQAAQTKLASREPMWTEQNSSSQGSKKALWATAAAAVVVSLAVGGFMLGRRSGTPTTQLASTPANSATQPAVSAQPAVATEPAAPATPASLQPDGPASELAASREVAAAETSATKSGNATQPAPRRSGISVGKLRAPAYRAPATLASSEPPPVLAALGSALADNVIGSGLLSSAGRSNVPAPPPVPGGQLQAPKLISSPSPVYPTLARAQNIQGVVLIDALVDATGKVAEMKVISGPVLLRQAATDALRDWKYQPARLNGQAIAAHINVSISFAVR
jgi:TonB family protein